MSDWHYETDYPLHCAMRILSDNLAIAAALCRSFELGGSHASNSAWERQDNKYADRNPWRPGCGLPAPRVTRDRPMTLDEVKAALEAGGKERAAAERIMSAPRVTRRGR